jgi:hypothetical protein
MMYENRMLGVPRMRQIRVTNTSCLANMNKQFKSAIRKCYSPYGLRDEDVDRAAYIPEHRSAFRRLFLFPSLNCLLRKFTEESAWIHKTAAELNGVPMKVG